MASTESYPLAHERERERKKKKLFIFNDTNLFSMLPLAVYRVVGFKGRKSR